MDHTLFGCLRSPHAPAQGLHPAAFAPSPLTLHGRSDHVSYPDLASSSSSSSTSSPSTCIISNYAPDDGLYHPHHHPQQHLHHHRGHHPAPHSQHHTAAAWHIPQMSPGGGGARANLCHPHSHLSHDGRSAPQDLAHAGGPTMGASTPGLGGSSTPTGAASEFGRPTLSPAEAEKRNGKRKSDSSGLLQASPLTYGIFSHLPSSPPSITNAVAGNVISLFATLPLLRPPLFTQAVCFGLFSSPTPQLNLLHQQKGFSYF
ncbi:homeobox protein MOX-2 isoform X2 [Vanacampus margaritifer]